MPCVVNISCDIDKAAQNEQNAKNRQENQSCRLKTRYDLPEGLNHFICRQYFTHEIIECLCTFFRSC